MEPYGINIKKIKELREKNKLSQNALDAKAGIGLKTTRNVEGGQGITVKTLCALAEALGVHPGYFLD